MNRASGIIAGARRIEDGEVIAHGDSLLDELDRQCNRLGRTLTAQQRERWTQYDDDFLSTSIELLRAKADEINAEQ